MNLQRRGEGVNSVNSQYKRRQTGSDNAYWDPHFNGALYSARPRAMIWFRGFPKSWKEHKGARGCVILLLRSKED